MVNKLTISDKVVIITSLLVVLITSVVQIYSQEIKNMVSTLIKHIPSLLFWAGILTLLWRFTFIYLRNRLDSKVNKEIKDLEDKITLLTNIGLKNTTELFEIKTDLKFKEIINDYRSEMFYKSMVNPYSLNREHISISDYNKLAIPFVLYKKDGINIKEDVYAPLSLPTEKRKEKEYLRKILKENNTPPNETEILVKKYCIDCFD
jgi:hypothetical protein